MPKSSPAKVAVITRTKDRGILLERAIKSVHQQTMEDFVHVIVNDGGDTKVVEDLVEKYKKIIKDRVKIIHNPSSLGMEAASNKAIKSVDSVYVAIHDDDDSWHPDFLKETTGYLDTNNKKEMGAIVITDKIDEEIVGSAVQELRRERWMPNLRTLSLYDLCLDNFAVPISFIYRREVYDKIGYYDESLPVCGDWDFTLRFMRLYNIKLLRTEYALAYYHHRPKAGGVLGNSVFAGANLHEEYNTILANKYLREDLEKGGLGLGYLFSRRREEREKLWLLRNDLAEVKHQLANLERIVVDRTNYKAKVKKVVQRVSPKVYKGIKKLMGRG